jgi:homoserine kinase type II
MEDPRSLAGALVARLIGRLRAEARFTAAGWETFFDLVLALRFAWLSDWLRRNDREMVGLETVYVRLLLEGRDGWERAWA